MRSCAKLEADVATAAADPQEDTMSYREMLIAVTPETKAVGPYALSVAAAFGAHARLGCLVVDPVVPSYVIPEMPAEILQNARASARSDAQAALDVLRAQAREADVEVEPLVVQGMLDSAAGELTRMARYADLAVIEQPGPDDRNGEPIVLETLLFGSGRPLLVVPYIQRKPMKLDRVIVAWDESATAARAVGAAMPLLERAGQIEVVTVGDSRKADRDSPAQLAASLSRRGPNAQPKWLNNVGDVANTMLSHAADTGADLVVMGGYGHSRLREFILGGATRGMLSTMTVPVLMMH
jgi:nucleotide-binding universal stress UspA family protein